MASKTSALFAAVFLLVCLLQEGLSLNCYQCNSHDDTRCAMEDLPDELVVTCPEKTPEGKPYILCRKIKQMIDFEVNGLPPDNRVIRSCGWEDMQKTYSNRCYHRSGFGGRQEVCACQGEKCNGAGGIAASMVLLVAALVKIALL